MIHVIKRVAELSDKQYQLLHEHLKEQTAQKEMP